MVKFVRSVKGSWKDATVIGTRQVCFEVRAICVSEDFEVLFIDVFVRITDSGAVGDNADQV